MVFDIEVNGKQYKASRGETILEALNRNGIKVPTLCKMESFSPTGACRLCVVEVEGKKGLIPSCSYPVEEWMKIRTHSNRVINARKTIVELLLANHPDDCLYCVRNGNCELQNLAIELNIKERIFFSEKHSFKKDKSSLSIERDPSKCILCGRCVRVCEEQQNVSAIDFINRGNEIFIGTSFNKGLNLSSCINCGQCILVCPTGAITEKSHIPGVIDALNNPKKVVIGHYAPTVTVSIAEELGLKPGKDISGIINSALKRLGFDIVFDTAFGADITTIEVANELETRLNENNNLPLLSSCCPSWVQYIEEFYPELIPNLSIVKSPQQILGSLIKNYYAKINNINPEDIYNVAIMPCTAKKFEAQREEMTTSGISDNDAVFTTREFLKILHQYGIDLQNIDPHNADQPFATRSSAGKLFGTIGGLTESVIRTLHYNLTGKELKEYRINSARNTKDKKIFSVTIGKTEFNFAIISGLKHVPEIIKEIKNGQSKLHFIEVMACPGGCVNGGGQILNVTQKSLKARIKGLYDIDDSEMIRVSHKNPIAKDLYKDFLKTSDSDICKKLLHTSFSKRDVLL